MRLQLRLKRTNKVQRAVEHGDRQMLFAIDPDERASKQVIER